jgi:lipopolysaccharide export system protein LptC
MAQSKYKKSNKIKIILVGIVLIIIAIVIVVYIGYQQLSNAPNMILSTIEDGSDMSIGRIQQTATRDGKREWSLEASSARYSQSKKEVILNDLAMTFFLDDESEVYLTAQKGVLNTSTNDIEVTGNVVVKRETYELTTEKLNYRHDKRIVFSTVPVLIVGDDAKISADSASLNLNTKKLRLKGHVESSLSENISM